MSKRKNTLNDLEEFLKLQASTLVPPQAVETPRPIERAPIEQSTEELPINVPSTEIQSKPVIVGNAKSLDLLDEMKKLATHNKEAFYDNIIKAAEAMPSGSNDVLLINTALYLKYGDNWKAGIEEYWRKRKSL